MCNCKRYNTTTKTVVFTKNTTLDLAQYNVKSYSVINTGTSVAQLFGSLNIPSGAPMLSFLGDYNEVKKDLVQISFVGGTGNLIMFLNTYMDENV